MNFGGIELSDVFGGYEIVNIPASSLPQDVASAVFNSINDLKMLGATYDPIWYIGSQMVNGKNHLFLAKEVRSTKDRDTSIVGLVINVPPSKDAFKGKNAKISEIIEECKLGPELEYLFKKTMQTLVGVSYVPLFYIGHQIVKGTNHYFLAQARCIYPNADPYPVVICINDFQNSTSIVSIEKLTDQNTDQVLNYAFTW